MLHLRLTGSGAPVLLLHGAPSAAEDFRPVVERLGRRHRFIWPDLPGYGLSEPVEGKTTIARVQTLLEDAVLALGIKELAIVGFSLGAYRALSMALSGRLRITDLVLVGGYAGLDPADAEGMRGTAGFLRTLPDFQNPAVRQMFAERMLTPESAKANPEAAQRVGRWLDLTTPSLLADELESSADSRDLLPHLGLLRSRVTLRVGARDVATPARYSEELAKRIKGARLQVVPEAGHALLLEDPHRTLDALDEALKAQVATRREEG